MPKRKTVSEPLIAERPKSFREFMGELERLAGHVHKARRSPTHEAKFIAKDKREIAATVAKADWAIRNGRWEPRHTTMLRGLIRRRELALKTPPASVTSAMLDQVRAGLDALKAIEAKVSR